MISTYGCIGNNIYTHSGRLLDFADPQPDQIDIHDIAIGLSRENRFSNQSVRPISVASHCMAGSYMAPDPASALAFLFHDASEAYTGDVAKPLKNLIGPAFTEIEDRLQAVIISKFEIPDDEATRLIVKDIDRQMLDIEKAYAFNKPIDHWVIGPLIEPANPFRFISRFNELRKKQ